VARRREVVAAFLAASRDGDFGALLAVLDPDVELRADAVSVAMGGPAVVRGSSALAEFMSGRARAVRLALLDGNPGAVWSLRGEIKVVFAFTVENGLVRAIDLIADPERIAAFEVVSLAQRGPGDAAD
jgi:RNA polymerase sigma-70 factor (ECF subfamily)